MTKLGSGRGTAAKREAANRQAGKREAGSIAVLDRAANLLLALAQSAQPSTLNEAAERAKLSKATAFRILATLIEQGLVVQDGATSSYRLGVAPLRLATAVLDGMPVHAASRQAMRALCDELNETVVLSVRDGDHRVNIYAMTCTNAIGSSSRIGEPRPLYAGAASRALLAQMSDDEIEAYLGRTPLVATPSLPRLDRSSILREIAKARSAGFVSTAAEFLPDVHAVAAAIPGPDGQAVAALHVVVPLGRFSAKLEARCGKALVKAVRQIGRELAGR